MVDGVPVPETSVGAALFADISGFTPLTEALARALGPRHGAEELTHYLNRIYNVLIAEVDRFGGTVIGFSGDAITCWFADSPNLPSGASRAVAAGLAMQDGMKVFVAIALPGGETAKLEMKAAVASGGVRRFVVGDPDVQLIDTLAGDTIVRMAAAEHLANRGEVIIDEATAELLKATLEIKEWRAEPHSDFHTDRRFAHVGGFKSPVPPAPWPALPVDRLTEDQVRVWIHRPIYERLQSGLGESLTELRPAVALFMRFGGIDYESDPAAGQKLDQYVRWVQQVLKRYDGYLIQLTIGDKGSYLYASFGSLVAHEDDPARAVNTALELRRTPADLDYINHVQLGISQGLMRVGTYGADNRHTYGSLGDEVNLAARLMQHALPGTVLVSRRVQKHVEGPFVWESMAPIRVKGKSDPVPVVQVLGKQQSAAQNASKFARAMVGRGSELVDLLAFIGPIYAGHFAGIAIVYGEPGLGKSRLVYEVHRRLTNVHKASWFFCPTDQFTHVSLGPFRHFLRHYFAHDENSEDDENKERFDEVFEALLADIQGKASPELIEDLTDSRSFLGALVNLHWPNSLYETLEPQLRHEHLLEAVRCLVEAESLRQPVVLQVEDMQWLDSDSHDLLHLLTTDVEAFSLAIVGTSRYINEDQYITLRTEPTVTHKIIDLNHFTPEGIREMATEILGGTISDALAALLMEKTSGTPFFVEQMVLDLSERGLIHESAQGFTIDPKQAIEMPASINAILIARLDRLIGDVKNVVQTASVLGQEFDTGILLNMLKADEHFASKVKYAENQAIWSEMNEVQYFFRHALLRDAAYTMQVRTRLRQLHKLAAEAIEKVHMHDLPTHYAELIFHFNRAEDSASELRYALLAGDCAACESDNADAIAYFTRALELLPTADLTTRYRVVLAREHIYDLQGDRPAQQADLETLGDLANGLNDDHKRAEVDIRRVHYAEVMNDYDAVIRFGNEIVALGKADGLLEDQASGYLWIGRGLVGKAAFHEAETTLGVALSLALTASRDDLEADTLRELGIVATERGHYDAAREHFEGAIAYYRKAGYRRGECKTLNNLGMAALGRGDDAAAETLFEQALHLCHQIGYRNAEIRIWLNLGALALDEGDLTHADQCFDKALHIAHETGDRLRESLAIGNLGFVALRRGDTARAATYQTRALKLAHEIGTQTLTTEALILLSLMTHHLGDESDALAYAKTALQKARVAHTRPLEAQAWTVLGHIYLTSGQLDDAVEAYRHDLEIRRELDQAHLAMDAFAGLIEVALTRQTPDEARDSADQIARHLDTNTLDGAADPFHIYLMCYRALHVLDDPRAEAILERAHRELRAHAADLPDALRVSYLENVPSHREIVACWKMHTQLRMNK
jgi:predicted ATPase/class 3 adenylate cyclase